jgi:hypothetical protein
VSVVEILIHISSFTPPFENHEITNNIILLNFLSTMLTSVIFLSHLQFWVIFLGAAENQNNK